MTNQLLQNLHLYISIPVVIGVALVYGFQPQMLFDIQPNSVDEHNVYKAVMGIYLAFAFFWWYGVVHNLYWKAATLSNVLFMLGLALGRLVSFAIDGIPSNVLFVGFFGELVLAVYGMYQLKKSNLSNYS
jgi:Domain of unknown function (DUF4345)